MKYRTRTFYSETQKALMWERWREGESLHAIAQMFDRNHTSVRNILARAGGSDRQREHARLEPWRCRARKDLPRRDGGTVGASDRPATTARTEHSEPRDPPQRRPLQLPGERGRSSRLGAGAAAEALERARNRALARAVAEKLRLEWSPYQVAGWLKRRYPQDETRQVSHETIYRTLFIQARGALKKELLQHLRRTRGMRRSRHHTQKGPTMAGSPRRCRSASDQPRPRTERCPVTGKAICSSAATTARSPLWWSAKPATSCW